MEPTAERGHVTESMGSREKCEQGPVFGREAGTGWTAVIWRGRGLNLDAVVVNSPVRQEKFELVEGF